MKISMGVKVVYISMLSAKWRKVAKLSKYLAITNAQRLINDTVRQRSKF